ncbi:tetratricopeptide repeat protein, partial [bacterium]|nr:tetratricopeptide repeat protein [bacterium]
LARLAGDAALEARLQDDLGELKLHEGKYDEGRALLEAALALGRELGDRSCEASALFHLGDLEHILGRNAESRARLETALELCRASEELSLEAGVLSTLGSIHFRSGRREEGLDCYDRALAAFQRLGHRQNEAAMIGNIGMMHAREGDLKGALAHLERTLAIYVETGHQNGEAFARANMAELLLDLGLLEDARGYNEAAFAIKREGGNRRYLSAVHVISGRIALDRGRQDEATSWFEKALAAGRELGERHHEAEALGYLGCALLERGEPGAARARLEEAVAIFRRSDTELLGIDLAFLSVALVSEGRQDEATSSLEEAERLLREHGRDRRAVVTVCRGHLDLALLARALEEHDEAAAGRHRELVRSAIAAARPAAPSPEGSPGDRSADVRLALRLLEKAAGRAGLTVSAPAEARPDVEASRPVSRESEPATLAEAPRASGELRPIVRLEFTGEDEGEKRIVMFNDRREKLSASHHEVLFRLAVHHQAQPGKPCPLPKESGSRRNFQTRLGELRKRSKISRSLKETLETLPPLFHPKEPRFHPGVIVIVTIA